MKNHLSFILMFLIGTVVTSCGPNNPTEPETPEDPGLLEEIPEPVSTSAEINELKIESLLKEKLELREGVEVVMSYLEVPPNTTLPAHFHPGEEFVYVMEGSGELSVGDNEPVMLNKGDVTRIPLKAVHSFTTYDNAAIAVVFRVHEAGEPERIMVDQ